MCPPTPEQLLALVSSASASRDCKDEWAQAERFSAALYAMKASCPRCKAEETLKGEQKASSLEARKPAYDRLQQRQQELQEMIQDEMERQERWKRKAEAKKDQLRQEEEERARKTDEERLRRQGYERHLNQSGNSWRMTVLD